MQKNITLIGMPGAGKSTVGIILAKNLAMGFLDTDVLIQINRGQPLQDILDQQGYLALRQIEEQEICKLNITAHVIATGGSVAYSQRAMEHLASMSRILFLEVNHDDIVSRIPNFDTRGIAKAPEQSFEELYHERQILYRRYADIIVNCDGLNQEEVAAKVQGLLAKDSP